MKEEVGRFGGRNREGRTEIVMSFASRPCPEVIVVKTISRDISCFGGILDSSERENFRSSAGWS
jgi:hypothetical protein